MALEACPLIYTNLGLRIGKRFDWNFINMTWKAFNIIILVCFGFVLSAIAQPEQETRVYIARYYQLAMSEQQRTGVPAAIKLAQGIYESASGTSDLASRSNNHFGIKCKSSWRGDTVLHDDDLRQECFRKYPSVEKSYMDHSDFLKGSPRYANLFKLEQTDYIGWATGLKQAGYATNPAYVRKITDLIERYELQQYSVEALKGTRVSNANPDKEWLATKPASDSIQELVVVDYKGLKGFWASKGQILLDKAVLYNVKYTKLLYLNDLTDGPLPSDMFIFIEPKRTEGQNETHLVRDGETMQLISQKEAIRLDSLMAYNHLLPKQEVMSGERVVLKSGKISYPKTTDNQVAGRSSVTTIVSAPSPVVAKTTPPVVAQIDTPKVEAPVVVAPKVVTPVVAKIDTPKVEAPVVVAPKVVTPVVAKIDTPKAEAPVVVAPKVIVKVDSPKTVAAPKVLTPKVNVDTPKLISPVVTAKIDVPKTTASARDTVIKIQRTAIPQTATVRKDNPSVVGTQTPVSVTPQKATAPVVVAKTNPDTNIVIRRTQPANSSDIIDIEKARRTEALLSSNPLTPIKTVSANGASAVSSSSNTTTTTYKVEPKATQQPPVKRTYNDPNLSAPVKDLKKKFDQIVYDPSQVSTPSATPPPVRDPAPTPRRDSVKSPVIISGGNKQVNQKPVIDLPPHLKVDTSKPKPTPPPVRMRPAEVIIPTTNYDEPNVSDTVKNLRKKFDAILNTPLPERPYKESPPITTPNVVPPKPTTNTATLPSKPAAKPAAKPTAKPVAKPKPTATKTPAKKPKK
jgi:hypothetical protein